MATKSSGTTGAGSLCLPFDLRQVIVELYRRFRSHSRSGPPSVGLAGKQVGPAAKYNRPTPWLRTLTPGRAGRALCRGRHLLDPAAASAYCPADAIIDICDVPLPGMLTLSGHRYQWTRTTGLISFRTSFDEPHQAIRCRIAWSLAMVRLAPD